MTSKFGQSFIERLLKFLWCQYIGVNFLQGVPSSLFRVNMWRRGGCQKTAVFIKAFQNVQETVCLTDFFGENLAAIVKG